MSLHNDGDNDEDDDDDDVKVVGEEGEQDLSEVPADFIVKDADAAALGMSIKDEFKDAKVQQKNETKRSR